MISQSLLQRSLPDCQRMVGLTMLLGVLWLPTGCTIFPAGRAQPTGQPEADADSPSVETILAETGSVAADLTYTGTTTPVQQVSLRAQAAGQVRQLTVDVGDRVARGQLLAQIDDSLLTIDVQEAQSELASRQSEVAQAEAEVSDAQTEVARARVELQQAQSDADRLRRLANAGAISEQEAEQAESTLAIAQQALNSAQQQVATQRAAVQAAEGQVSSQQAVLGRSQEQFSFTQVLAPLNGVVLSRQVDAGDVLQVGDEIAQVGDFSATRVDIQVSELDLAQIQLGQAVQVRLDAFPQQPFTGSITRISPAADPTARLVPVEVTLANPNGQIGSGLLARVTLTPTDTTLVVPTAALDIHEGDTPLVYVVTQQGEQATVEARPVELGDQQNGQVEIRSGIEAGESIVVRSSSPLSDAQSVKLSILSAE